VQLPRLLKGAGRLRLAIGSAIGVVVLALVIALAARDPGDAPSTGKDSANPLLVSTVSAVVLALALVAALRRKEPLMSLKRATLVAIVLVSSSFIATMYEASSFSSLRLLDGALAARVVAEALLSLGMLVFLVTLYGKQGGGT
jgi:hypothetical protein